MNGVLVVQSNSITVKDGKVLMKSSNGKAFTPGGVVLEGEDPEEVCKKSMEKAKIIKPLHPGIFWKNIGSEKIPIVSLNYLTEIENV
ncbi:MAG: NUDIX hydrolase [Candidatus Pacearchaeota archaeon]